jgi:hypothetical protein
VGDTVAATVSPFLCLAGLVSTISRLILLRPVSH